MKKLNSKKMAQLKASGLCAWVLKKMTGKDYSGWCRAVINPML